MSCCPAPAAQVGRGVVFLLLSLISTTAPAAAQSRVRLGLGGGLDLPGSHRRLLRPSYQVRGLIAVRPYTLCPFATCIPLETRFDLAYDRLDRAGAGSGVNVFEASASLVYVFHDDPLENPLRVEALLGGGIYAVPDASSPFARGLRGGPHLGLGLRKRWGGFTVFLEARYAWLIGPGQDFGIVPITLGFVHRGCGRCL